MSRPVDRLCEASRQAASMAGRHGRQPAWPASRQDIGCRMACDLCNCTQVQRCMQKLHIKLDTAHKHCTPAGTQRQSLHKIQRGQCKR
eukprot:365947-Chlamydomonas_euryale.AAC.5